VATAIDDRIAQDTDTTDTVYSTYVANGRTVQFAGLVAPGEYQFNVYVPQSAPNGDNPITVQYGGLSTQSGVLLTVQH
jgi:uncharacterized protein (TIGR03437 family)